MHLLLFLLCFARIATSDMFPDYIPAKDMHGNCGTIQSAFRMGELLKNDTNQCHSVRWSAQSYDIQQGCTCEFYRDRYCKRTIFTVSGPRSGTIGKPGAFGFACDDRRR